jgi:hypothetical protein
MVNIVYQTVTESAANTLTYAKFETGYGTLDKTGWIINRIEYFPIAFLPDANNDSYEMAITTSNQLAALGLDAAAVKHYLKIMMPMFSSVGWAIVITPHIIDLSTLPGRGLLVLPVPLYIAIKGTGLPSALTVKCRLYFETVDLDDQMWVELVEQTRLLS